MAQNLQDRSVNSAMPMWVREPDHGTGRPALTLSPQVEDDDSGAGQQHLCLGSSTEGQPDVFEALPQGPVDEAFGPRVRLP